MPSFNFGLRNYNDCRRLPVPIGKELWQMNYLDAAIGFAVVMATFAGAATGVTEAIKRWHREKARNLLKVIDGLQARLAEYQGIEVTPDLRYSLFREIVNNPVLPEEGLAAPSDVADPNAAVKALLTRKPPQSIFAKVSTEHVCRRTAEVLYAAGVDPDTIEKALAKTAQDFDLLSSSISTEFQNKTKRISIIAGMAIALIFNINAYRILDTFIQNPQLPQAVASDLAKLAESEPCASEEDCADVQAEVDELGEVVDRYAGAGLPVGWRFPPHCLPAEICQQRKLEYRLFNWGADIAVLLLTGTLIGLGAPFWFDVARRLATVRSWFSGTATTSEARAGRDVKNSSQDRKALAREIVEDLTT
jgi:hypothetical protein